MIEKEIWATYCKFYGEFGEGPVSVPEVLESIKISPPMCKKAFWVLKQKGLLERLGREKRRVKFRVVPPREGAMRLALLNPWVRYREVLNFFRALEGLDWYVTGSTALNYYAPCHAPVVELASRNAKRLGAVATRFPFIHVVTTDQVPLKFEAVEFKGLLFKIASVEDAIVQAYSSFPATLASQAELDYMAAIAMRIKGKKLDVQRLKKELPKHAFERIQWILSNLDMKHALKREAPKDEVEQEAARFFSADSTFNAGAMVEALSEMSVRWGAHV